MVHPLVCLSSLYILSHKYFVGQAPSWPRCACLCVCSIPQPCLILCDPVDCSPPIFSVHGILQATILEWVARPSSRGSSSPKEQTLVSYVSCIGRSANSTTWEAWIRCSAHQKCLRNIFENDFLYFFFNLVQGVVTKSEHRYETKMTTKNLSLCFELSTL